MTRHRLLVVLLVIGFAAAVPAQAPQAVILVTLDGARTEEVFGGLDVEIVKAQLKDKAAPRGTAALQALLGRRRPEARRAKLMPFFWGTLMREHGSIAGNPARSSRVHLTNGLWFSYPGYSEILVGPRARRCDQEQRSGSESVSDGPGVPEGARRTVEASRSPCSRRGTSSTRSSSIPKARSR